MYDSRHLWLMRILHLRAIRLDLPTILQPAATAHDAGVKRGPSQRRSYATQDRVLQSMSRDEIGLEQALYLPLALVYAAPWLLAGWGFCDHLSGSDLLFSKPQFVCRLSPTIRTDGTGGKHSGGRSSDRYAGRC